MWRSSASSSSTASIIYRDQVLDYEGPSEESNVGLGVVKDSHLVKAEICGMALRKVITLVAQTVWRKTR